MISNPAATKPIPQCKQRHCSGPQRPLQQNGMKIEEDYKIQTSTNLKCDILKLERGQAAKLQ